MQRTFLFGLSIKTKVFYPRQIGRVLIGCLTTLLVNYATFVIGRENFVVFEVEVKESNY